MRRTRTLSSENVGARAASTMRVMATSTRLANGHRLSAWHGP